MQSIEWRPVVGYEGFYEVSSDGQARRLPTATRGMRTLTLGLEGNYLNVSFHRKKMRVNRVVAEAFHGPANGLEACHNNGIPTDNRASNIRWGTRSENALDSVAHGTHNHARNTSCPKGHPFEAANTYVHPTRGYRKCRTCMRAHDANRESARRVVNGKRTRVPANI